MGSLMGSLTGVLYGALVVYLGGWYLGKWTGNFSLLLFILTVATLAYWLAERFHFAPRRAAAAATLDRQDAASLEAFERRVAPDDAVQQCYRVSPGPDFVLIVTVRDMSGYQALAQRLFTNDANVRNVKTFFSVKRSKFEPKLLLPQ
jgi:hypothetical protein